MVNLKIDIVTFDCYGTLIDWEAGIKSSFLKALAKYGAGKSVDRRVFELYEDEERRIEREAYRPYRQVLSESVQAVAKKVGWPLTREQSSFLGNDLPNWEPFADTNLALKRLAEPYRLGILSNVDNDLLAGTLKHLEVPFQTIVTAEQVRAYKPNKAHFEKAGDLIGKAGWVHVAGSTYHDIEPTQRLGIRGVWVNRNAAPVPGYLVAPVEQVRNLKEVADLLGA